MKDQLYIQNKLNFILFFALGINTVIQKVNAQWVPTNGPLGGSIARIASNSTTLFASNYKILGPPSGNGVYRSANNGGNWNLSNNGITDYDVSTIATLGSTIFAGTSDSGLFISNNDGVNWTKCPQLFGGGNNIHSLCTDGNRIYVSSPCKIYFSDDYGITWDSTNAGLGCIVFTRMAAKGSNIVGCFPFYGGTVYSNDGGLNWNICVFCTDANFSSVIIVDTITIAGNSQNSWSYPVGFWYSDNYGANWNTASPLLATNAYVNSFSFLAGIVFAGTNDGIWQSPDTGKTWSYMNNTAGWFVNDLAVRAPNKIWAATSLGIQFSTNNGTTWFEVNNGINATSVSSLVHDATTLFAGLPSTGLPSIGIYTTTNSGTTWLLSNNGLLKTNINTLASISGNVFAGTDSGVYLSNNGGANWNIASNGLSSGNMNITGFLKNGSDLFAATWDGVCFTNNNGANWSVLNSGFQPATGILALGKAGPNLIAQTNGNGLYISYNYGLNWSSVPSQPFYSANSFASINSNIYAGTYSGVFMSSDNGISWSDTLLTGISVTTLATFGSYIFAGTDASASGRLYRLLDGDTTWTAFDTGLPANTITSLTDDGTYMYAATLGQGVWKRLLSELTGISNPDFEPGSSIIHPNPTISEINIELMDDARLLKVSLTNLQGRVVYNQDINPGSQKIKINLKHYSKGLYLLKAVSDKSFFVKKIIIQ